MSAGAHGTDEPGSDDPTGEPTDGSAEDAGPRRAAGEAAGERPGDGIGGEPADGVGGRPSEGGGDEVADAVEPAGASDAADDPSLAPDEVDSRWTDIVTRLREPADPRGWAPDPDVAEAESHFVPPEPGPVLGGDPLLTMAWAAVVAFPVLIVVIVLAWRDAPTWVLQAGGVLFLLGAGLLVWRMPHERDPDDTDPGAVV